MQNKGAQELHQKISNGSFQIFFYKENKVDKIKTYKG